MTLTYRYIGTPLVATGPVPPGSPFPDTFPGYAGIIMVDEALVPGGSLVNATVTFIGVPGGPLPAGLLDFDFGEGTPGFPFPATAGASLTIRTNALREIVAWQASFLDGPPDGSISSSIFGDSFFDPTGPGNTYYSVGIGSWSIIPLPPALALFLTAMGALGILGWRRKRHTAGTA